MRKLFLKSFIIFVIAMSHSFFIKAQTTQEEYNYLTKGYKVQMESGLDMKKGYTLEDLGDWSYAHGTEIRKCTFKSLIRENDGLPCATLLIYQRADIPNGAVFYICIPSFDAAEDIWQQTNNYIKLNVDETLPMQAIIYGLMRLNSQQISK